ncbi:MAG: class I SAM-dependent methyltransferase [Sphaerochaetaceae bacterium]|nr:class I SAM-dependent methyltransferase [Sphaerochaetaceae bacterium]
MKHQKIWKEKKILREIYAEWYNKIIFNLSNVSGKTLELGSGTGNFKEYKPDIISSDIDSQPWLDISFDAHKIPYNNSYLANIVMIDVLHHLSDPIKFFHEAHRVLKKKGRIIMIEPYPSPISSIVYKLFHPEPFIFNVNIFGGKGNFKEKKPWESNQAIPYLIFFKNLKSFDKIFSNKFNITKKDVFSFILYPLSGGFENKQLLPTSLIPVAKLSEILLKPFKNLIAFRCIIVLEKL